MKERRGGGKEREAPTHLIKNSKLTHAARVAPRAHVGMAYLRLRFNREQHPLDIFSNACSMGKFLIFN